MIKKITKKFYPANPITMKFLKSNRITGKKIDEQVYREL